MRDLTVGIQDKGKRPGQDPFHDFISVVWDWLGIARKLAETAAYKRKICFLPFDPFYLRYPVNRPDLSDITAQSINGIGGINDHATLLQTFCDDLQMPLTRIIGIDL
jgi:hypothetical protein